MNTKIQLLFVGYGSIAKQHINSIITICEERGLVPSFDLVRVKRNSIIDSNHLRYLGKIFSKYPKKKYDSVFITNPTYMHYDSLVKTIELSNYFFIEKPIFDFNSYDLSFMNNYNNKIIYVACPLRHTTMYKKIKEFCTNNSILSAQVICSSYLPEWREDQDYKNSYSSDSLRGGGVDLDLIHEWDYVVDLFGVPLETKQFKQKISKLTINSVDIAIYIARYKDKLVEIHLDYFGRKNIRNIRLFTNESTFLFDFLNGEITNETIGKTEYILDNKGQFNELIYFLDLINNKKLSNINTIENSLLVLNVAKGL
jgi:predicted dehydrogenase